MKTYQELENSIAKISKIQHIIALSNWDYATMMPKNAAHNRGEQIAELVSLAYEMFTNPKVESLIQGAEQERSQLNEWQQANLDKIKKDYINATCVNAQLLSEFTIASSESEMVWREARKENDFTKLKPYLQRVINAVNEIATIKSDKLGISKFDALIDQSDPGRTTEQVKNIFKILKQVIPNLLQAAIEKQKTDPALPIKDKVPAYKQKELAIKIAKTMGFDFNRGRFDESAHPFCFGFAGDVRITTRYNEDNFLTAIASTIHEVGHALYELNLPSEYANQPVGRALSMSLHESQSLLMEMQAGLSPEFMEYYARQIRDVLGLTGPEYSAANLYKLHTKVQQGLIRVDADEVSYPLHVILRFELEQELLSGNLKLDDLPLAWSAKMKEYIGVEVPNDKDGCMQDIHWPSGSFGYFHNYVFGAITAAQVMNAAKLHDNSIFFGLKNGDFTQLNEFLNKNIRQFGSLKSPSRLLTDATGSDLNPEIYIKYLTERYLS
ncbi:MAG: ctaQ [Rickettsiaceae bacterium]|jgi:carboxypeptidase Taq|nr:ctaQ [Rickettsiaceae bacterium]